jgi:outer membrane protein assembly factor BamE (lipoprotein component of BamABCDE complex)
MTNDETTPMNRVKPISLFGFHLPRRSFAKAGHSFVIRHSSFVICALALALSACNSSKTITKANVDEVVDGMSKKQVESILGPPTTVDTKDFALQKKTTYIYAQGKESVTIVFKDDKVQSKASTLSE